MKLKAHLFILLFLLSSLAGYSQTAELKKINFLPLWIPQPQFAGYYMAKEKGIYEKYGLDVNIIQGGFKKVVSQYLKDGSADFGIMYLSSALKEREMGLPLVNIGQIFQRSELIFVAKKSSGINSLKDFNGKKIALWRTVLEELTLGFLEKHNIKAEVIKINEGVNIFIKNAVDICAVMYYNEYNNLINFGIDPDELNIFFFRDYGMDLPEDGIYCTEEFFAQNPEVSEMFVQASLEGWKYALANQEETLKIIETYQNEAKMAGNRTHRAWMLNSMVDLIKPPGKPVKMGELLESDFNNTIEFLIHTKVINSGIDFKNFYRGTTSDD